MLNLSEVLSASTIKIRHGLPITESTITMMRYIEDRVPLAKDIADKCEELMQLYGKAAEQNIHSIDYGDLPNIFDVSEVFDMTIQEFFGSEVYEGANREKVLDRFKEWFLKPLKEHYEDMFFATAPYNDCYFLLSDLQEFNNMWEMNELSGGSLGDDRFIDSSLSCMVRQIDLDEPMKHKNLSINYFLKDWTNDPRSIRQIMEQEELFREGGAGYNTWQNLNIEDGKFLLTIEFITRDVTHGPTWVNGIAYTLGEYGDVLQTTMAVNPEYDNSLFVDLENLNKQIEEDSELSEYVDNALGLLGRNASEFADLWCQMIFKETSILWLYGYAVLKCLIWMNSKNDIMEFENTESTRPERKRINRSARKKKEGGEFIMKTLRIKPSIVVVEPDGIERKPSASEIAQHSRRGNWAHYGVNGNGLLFGKYARPVYRKPTTVGKFDNGLVIKDYELLTGEES